MRTYRIIHYINQFFGQIGGEKAAYQEPLYKKGPIGPGVFLDKALKNGNIIGTIICGDNYSVEHNAKLREFASDIVSQYKPDIFIAGPGFFSGRYGLACGGLCTFIKKQFGIYCITGLYEENPAVDLYREHIDIIKTKANAAGMKSAIDAFVHIFSVYGAPREKNIRKYFFSKGLLKNELSDKPASLRSIDMLKSILKGGNPSTEIHLPDRAASPKAVLGKELCDCKIALITDGGLVPAGNPDKLKTRATTKFLKYGIQNIDTLKKGDWQVMHEGYDNRYVLEDPNRLVPLDALRLFEKEKKIKQIYDDLITTTGVATSLAVSQKIGREIGALLIKNGVDAVILTST